MRLEVCPVGWTALLWHHSIKAPGASQTEVGTSNSHSLLRVPQLPERNPELSETDESLNQAGEINPISTKKPYPSHVSAPGLFKLSIK